MKYIFHTFLLLSVIITGFIPADISVKGTITDESGVPIRAATIREKNTTRGALTDSNGKFAMLVTKDKVELVITAIGYLEKIVKANSKSPMSITLQPDTNALSEIVVVGYSTQRKAAITGSIAAGTSLYHYQTGAVSQQISGKVSGMMLQDNRTLNSAVKAESNNNLHNYGSTGNYNREGYDVITENKFQVVTDNPLSTFSIDVDAASYSNMRRFITNGQIPPAGAIRIEEMINYFTYDYPQPTDNKPFSINTELAECPWNKDHQLMLIGLQGKRVDLDALPPSNLVFLIDVSGSMSNENKLPLVKASLKLLADQLRAEDKVSIVTYAGSAGLALPATSGEDRNKIKEAIDRLESGGSTAGGAGIQLAYKVAREQFKEKGNNRVILCTDGDFNVGQSSDDALERMIEQERKSGVFLTVLGYGMGNYQDAKMQKLADKGNGNHAYIDGLAEAKKVLISEFGGTLYTIAKDVKLQIEFNPALVKGYRLIGYENRMLAKEDFNDDKKDAGELGSGHTVTAIYELVPPNVMIPDFPEVDSLKYQVSTQQPKVKLNTSFKDERVTIKLRYKEPDGETSKLLSVVVRSAPIAIEKASNNLRFAAAVASFGLSLRSSAYKGSASLEMSLAMAKKSLGVDKEGYRREFMQLVEKAQGIYLKKEQAHRYNQE